MIGINIYLTIQWRQCVVLGGVGAAAAAKLKRNLDKQKNKK